MNIGELQKSIRNSAEISFSRSGGPGGQNVNKLNTKVTLRIKLANLAGLSEAELARLQEVLGPRISGKAEIWNKSPELGAGPFGTQRDTAGNFAAGVTGELVISSSEERSQGVNLERAYIRVEELICAAARLPKKRRPTKPSRAAREQRLQTKHVQAEKKTRRLPPAMD